jgi:hypothetical protein
MGCPPRYSLSLLVVLIATLGTFAVFTFAKPQYNPRYESKMIDFSKQNYVSPDTARVAFAKQGDPASDLGGIRVHSAQHSAGGSGR